MRTTLDIDEDLLAAAKELARRERSTAGRVVSRLLRLALTGVTPGTPEPGRRKTSVAGFQAFPARPGTVTSNQIVNDLREAEGI